MATIDPVELGKWERNETERGRAARGFWGVWYNYMPKLFGWTLSPVRFILGSIRGFSFFALSLSPIWLKFYDHTSTLSWGEAIGISAVLSVFMVFNFGYDKFMKEYKPKTVASALKKRLSLELGGVVSKLACSVKRRTKEHESGVREACDEMLKCIRDAARIYLGDYEGAHVEVSLLLFHDAECKQMRIAHRTTLARPTGRIRNSDEIMAYYVARGRKHRVVHDFLSDPHPFPKTSLSNDAATYRSLLLIPLIDTSSSSPDTCLGVVTVDSSRPYHFWPGNGQSLVVELKAFLSLLVLFLNLNEAYRLNCVGT